MNRRAAGSAVLGGALLLTLLTAACGVPRDSEVEVVPVVPYGLLSPSGPTPSTSGSPVVRGPRVWLVRGDLLVPAEAPSAGSDAGTTATALLRRLAGGPTEQERAHGLATAFGPGVELTLTEVTGGHAVVDIRAGDLAPSPSRLPLAVGQLVLTLVSVDGIDDVRLTSAGSAAQAPLPGGALTDRPLRASDYAALRAPDGSPSSAPPAGTATGPASPAP
jgi:Sporulation and spore germination